MRVTSHGTRGALSIGSDGTLQLQLSARLQSKRVTGYY